MLHQLMYYTLLTVLLTCTININKSGGMVTAERMIRLIFNNGKLPGQYNACSDYEYQRFIDPIFAKINITATITTSINNVITTITNTTSTMINSMTANGNVRTRRLQRLPTNQQQQQQSHRRTAPKKYPNYCKDNCAGYVKGTCRATNCVGYRRQHQYRSLESEENDDEEDNDNDDDEDYDDMDEEEHYSMTCEEQINDIHKALDKLIRPTSYYSYYSNTISTSCQRFITKSKRKAECYDDVIYGEIMSFTFWNMNYPKSYHGGSSSWSSYSTPPRIKIKENVTTDGLNVCHNIPLNIEANINSCVNVVHFKIRGWNNTSSTGTIMGGNMKNATMTNQTNTNIKMYHNSSNLLMKYERIDDRHPMYLFDTTIYANTKGGRYLLPGSYTLTATPDRFRSKQRTLRFNVITC